MRRGAPSTQRMVIRGDCCRARRFARSSSPDGSAKPLFPIISRMKTCPPVFAAFNGLVKPAF
ncbi:MAG: hypothetical protein ACTSYG_10480 [Candidatus Heimdallarchaeota archaeon]